jgi:hypothetical protein
MGQAMDSRLRGNDEVLYNRNIIFKSHRQLAFKHIKTWLQFRLKATR